MSFTHAVVHETLLKGIQIGEEAGVRVACAMVDETGRLLGVLRHHDAMWVAPDLAIRKATLAAGFLVNTYSYLKHLQENLPIYGASLAGLSSANDWFLSSGGVPVFASSETDREVCLGAVGISGAPNSTVEDDIATRLVSWIDSYNDA